ncbi:MAG: beta-glycosidase, partial [Bacteroidales bacterium]|nr:beta-glycosidase [Bacteroidales bacterium]
SDIMSDFKMFINGHRFTPKGGNWGFSEFNLRYGAAEYDTAVAMHREMNLNMIRNWVGQTGDEEFYEACDKYGIVVWQDFWLANPADGPDPDDEDMFVRNAEDYVGRIRHHPSIGLYCGRNEGYPPASLDARLKAAVASLHGDIAYIPNSADDGVSGHGPYRAVEPDSYFRIPTPKFHSERGMPAIMNYGSLLKTMTAEHIWPYDDVWGQHDFTRTGAQGDTTFIRIVRDRYGDRAMEPAEEFARYAQYLNYDGYRAMYEANNVGRKGLLIWMSHSCWPSLAWQTYDYWFDRTWAFMGVQKACEPLHVQINPVSRTVQAVNTTPGPKTGLKARVSLCGLDGKETYSKETPVDIGEDSTIDVLDISDVPDGPAIVTLELTTENGTVLSWNRYMRNFKGGDDTGDYREIVMMETPEVTAYVCPES